MIYLVNSIETVETSKTCRTAKFMGVHPKQEMKKEVSSSKYKNFDCSFLLLSIIVSFT